MRFLAKCFIIISPTTIHVKQNMEEGVEDDDDDDDENATLYLVLWMDCMTKLPPLLILHTLIY